MPKFIMSALPGLLIGLIVGFAGAKLGGGSSEDASPERDRKLAKMCMAEAKRMLITSEHASRARSAPARPEGRKGAQGGDDDSARAERAIASTLKRARTEKRWTVAHGKAAERIFPRLGEEAAAEFSKKILTAVESGDLTAEADAWLPEKK